MASFENVQESVASCNTYTLGRLTKGSVTVGKQKRFNFFPFGKILWNFNATCFFRTTNQPINLNQLRFSILPNFNLFRKYFSIQNCRTNKKCKFHYFVWWWKISILYNKLCTRCMWDGWIEREAKQNSWCKCGNGRNSSFVSILIAVIWPNRRCPVSHPKFISTIRCVLYNLNSVSTCNFNSKL